MRRITPGCRLAQVLERQVVHVGGDSLKPLRKILERVLDAVHARSLPVPAGTAAEPTPPIDAPVILRVAGPAR